MDYADELFRVQMRLVHAEGSGGGLGRNAPFWTNSQGALGVRPSGGSRGSPGRGPSGWPSGGSPRGIPQGGIPKGSGSILG